MQAEGLAWEPFKVAGAGEVTDSRLQMVEESVVLVNGDLQDDSGVLCPGAWTSWSASPLGPPRKGCMKAVEPGTRSGWERHVGGVDDGPRGLFHIWVTLAVERLVQTLGWRTETHRIVISFTRRNLSFVTIYPNVVSLPR